MDMLRQIMESQQPNIDPNVIDTGQGRADDTGRAIDQTATMRGMGPSGFEREMMPESLPDAPQGQDGGGNFGSQLKQILAGIGRSGTFDQDAEGFLESLLGSGLGTFAGIQDEREGRAMQEAEQQQGMADRSMEARRGARDENRDNLQMLRDIFGVDATEAKGIPMPGDVDVPIGDTSVRFRTLKPDRDRDAAEAETTRMEQQQTEAEDTRQRTFYDQLKASGDPSAQGEFIPGFDYAEEFSQSAKAARTAAGKAKPKEAEEEVAPPTLKEWDQLAAEQGAEWTKANFGNRPIEVPPGV